jgi:uncharacterized protein YecT (DUF1311 family)
MKPSMSRWLLVAALTAPVAAHAAGFDCSKASSASEKAICADDALSKQDSELAAQWKQIRAHASDAATLQAQREWIVQRNRCGNDVACLKQSYRQRLAALNGMPGDADEPRFQQTWKLDSRNDSYGSELVISGTRPLHFSLNGWNGGNVGGLEGDAIQDAHTHARYDKDGCTLDFFLRAGKLVVEEKEHGGDGCGAGMGVDYGGSYVTAAQHASKPEPDLRNLGIVASAEDETAVRKLLGKDYATLVDDVNMRATDTANGITTTQLWVRGIANTNAAILMDDGRGSFHIGLLVFARGDHLRMRYYTNVAADKHALPKPIRDWHDQIDATLPIDMMP